MSDNELHLFHIRLRKMGVHSEITRSSNRFDRGQYRLVIPFSELPELEEQIGHLIVPSKKYLLKINTLG